MYELDRNTEVHIDMAKSRKLKLDKYFEPISTLEGDEIFRSGFFKFNITRILEDISAGKLKVVEEPINVSSWSRMHSSNSLNEGHLPSVDINKTVLQAEIRAGIYNIIDGNHRIEKARREGVEWINSYMIKGEQLVPYFIEKKGYEAFVEYWNSKL